MDLETPPPNIPTDLETFLWKGQLRYKCPRNWESGAPCQFNTFDLDAMRHHIASPHSYSGKEKDGTTGGPVKNLKPEFGSSGVAPELENVKFAEPPEE